MKMQTKYTWIPDLPDFRDHIYAPSSASPPPEIKDLRPGMPPVFDQGHIGSCTGNAYAGALEFLEADQRTVPSRLFIYYNERRAEHTTAKDAGAYVRDGAKTLAKYGWADENLWPYAVKAYRTRPGVAVYADAAKRKITEYLRITDLASMKTCLAEGFPFVFGFSVYESFESLEVAKTGVVPLPTKKEKLIGGHAVLCVGYNDAEQRVIVRNSWGASWGQSGYFTMPYDYIGNKNLADDMWVVRK